MGIKETNHRWRTALAARDRALVEELLRADTRLALMGHEASGSMRTVETAELRGLLLLGGDHDDGDSDGRDVPFAADAPWRIPDGTGLAGALEHVWAPVAAKCPQFVAVLRAEVLGLALVRMDGAYLLGYLHLADRSGELPRDVRDLPPYTGSDSLTVLWGTAPTRLGTADVVPVLGGPLPTGVRDLAAVHARLATFDFDMALDRFTTTLGATTRADYEGEDPAEYGPGEDFTRAANGDFDRWIRFCTCDSAAEAYYLDLDDRDPGGVPRVALSGINGTSERPGDAFWDWVDEVAPSLLFCT